MCLGIVGRVLALPDQHPDLADVEVAGLSRKINIGLLPPGALRLGDWVVIHAGFAMETIDEETARAQLSTLREYTRGVPAESRLGELSFFENEIAGLGPKP